MQINNTNNTNINLHYQVIINNNNKFLIKKKITFCSNKRSVHDFDKIKG